MSNPFINYRYARGSIDLLCAYMNTFVRRAIGFKWGTVFIGVLISDPNPPRVVSVGKVPDSEPRWPLGAKVRKNRGSSWRGTVCGYYSTPHTPVGYYVDSAFEPGSVQVWPEVALEDWDGE